MDRRRLAEGCDPWLQLLLLPFLLFLACAGSAPVVEEAPAEDARAAFETIMQELARAWNEGDAARAADCFTEDAVYSDPPERQLYRGRAELFEFFGGEEGRAGQMRMLWHHLAHDPESGIGFGEFSFTYGSTAHGVAVVQIRDGKIARWREYWYDSDLPWEDFVASNPF